MAFLGSLAAGTAQAGNDIAAPRAAWNEGDFAGLQVIYSTFSDDKQHLYDPDAQWLFEGSRAAGSEGSRYAVGMPFTPQADGTVHKIVLAIGLYAGADDLISMSLHEDASGLPGALIKKFHLVGVPPFGQCCQTFAVGMKGIPVVAGTQYWVVMSAKGDTVGAWYDNDLGLKGLSAAGKDGKWHRETEEPLTAFSVLGD